MIGQELDDEFDGAPSQNRGTVMSYDDLEVGQYYCVYNLRRQPDESAPIMGQSFQVKAICLPYYVVQILTDPTQPVITLDARYLNLMKVTKEFVLAQQDGVGQAMAQQQMMMTQRQMRKAKKQQEGE